MAEARTAQLQAQVEEAQATVDRNRAALILAQVRVHLCVPVLPSQNCLASSCST